MRKLALAVVLVAWVAPAWATVITTGDVDPGGAATQPDPWSTEGSLKVGDTGEGTLNIEAGGQVSNEQGYIGRESGSTGEATVTGGGSKWTNSLGLVVGRFGDGTLSIEAGGVVSNTRGYISSNSGSTGVVTVSGAGSKWTNLDNLYVGLGGRAALNITDGGLVEVGSDTWVGEGFYSLPDDDLIHFDNGTLTTESLYSAVADLDGTGTIHTHGLVSDVDLVFDATHGLMQSFTLANPGQNISVHLDVDGTGAIGAGHSGSGTLRIADGVIVSSPRGGYIGYKSGSTGAATVTGAGSMWNNSYSLFVGYYGEGALNIEAGGEVSSSGDFVGYGGGYIGFYSGSTGAATVSGAGSKWNNSENLFVGYYGDGTLDVADGGVVSDTWGYIGFYSDSTGTATVTGADSQWTSADDLYVGYEGEGALNIEAGGEVSNMYGSIGDESGSTGIATVSGAGSKWTNWYQLVVGDEGNGTLNVEAGGEVSNTTGAIGSYNRVTGIATVTGANSKWINSGWLYVGERGSGTLNVEAGGEVFSGNSYIGYDSYGTGIATVSGAGSMWNNSGLYVGYEGEGALNIEAGGEVSSFWGYIGDDSGSTGVVTVTGAGSKWNSSSLGVGSEGDGTLNVEAGGEVFSYSGYIGRYSGSTGVATVTGSGSKWTASSSSLKVGSEGDGTLNVAAGGEVSSSSGYIGDESGSTGIVTVTGTGSKWTNSENLFVGGSGNGTLNIEAGGMVSNTNGYIGGYRFPVGSFPTFSGVGIVTVTGAGSRWTNSSKLHLGGAWWGSGGSGTLNIHDSGLVTVSDTTKLWDEGTIHLDGGTLDTGTLDLTVGTFNMLDGLLRADSVIGDITIQGGIVAPGHSPAVVSITGDYAQGADATLEIEVTGTSVGEAGYDQLSVSGTAALDGTLDIQTDASFTPSVGATAGVIGDLFVIVSAGSVTGTFAAINGRHVGDGKFYLPQYHATRVTLGAFQAAPGDTDGDMDVDLSDYNSLTTNFDPIGTYGPYLWGDGNSDGDNDVDLADYNALASNFSPAGYGAAAVPEPSSLVLFIGGILAVAGAGGWRY